MWSNAVIWESGSLGTCEELVKFIGACFQAVVHEVPVKPSGVEHASAFLSAVPKSPAQGSLAKSSQQVAMSVGLLSFVKYNSFWSF